MVNQLLKKDNNISYHNNYNRNENTILCSSSGTYISKYNIKIWASDCFSIIPNSTILNNYLYYYLKSIHFKMVQHNIIYIYFNNK